MLTMRPGCECCNRDLPADQGGAFICSFECTFCETCATGVLRSRCPNCSGALEPRPVRASGLLQKYPPSTERVWKPQGCTANTV